MVEPWLRGTLTELDPLRRGAVHALWLASEDVARWCTALADKELEVRVMGLPSVAFQMRHIVRSLDRLLTYAEGHPLEERQRKALGAEMEAQSRGDLFAEFEAGMRQAESRVKGFSPEEYAAVRGGRTGDAAGHGWRSAGALRGPHAEALRADGDDGKDSAGGAGVDLPGSQMRIWGSFPFALLRVRMTT